MSTPQATNGRGSDAATPRRGGRAAPLDRGRAVRPRRRCCCPTARSTRSSSRRASSRGLLPRAPRARSTSRCSTSTRGRADRRAHASPSTSARAASSTPPAAQAASTLLAGRGPRRRQRAPVRADRARQRAAAPPAAASYEIQAQRPRPRGATARPRRARRARHPRGRPRRPRARTSARSSELLARRARQAAEALARGPARITGTPSGFDDLDAITGGFQPGNLIIIAARPSMGKIGAGHQLRRERRARHVGKAGRAVLARDVRGRARAALHRLAGVDQGRRPAQGPRPAARWANEAACLAARLAHVAAPSTSTTPPTCRMLDVRAKARRLHQQNADGGLGLIIVDYLQLMRADARSRTASSRSAQITRGLKIARPRARRAGDRALPAQPRRRAAHRQAPDALRPARVGLRSSRTPTS